MAYSFISTPTRWMSSSVSITFERRPDGIFLHQRTYTLDVIKRAVMTICKLCMNLVNLKMKFALDSGPPVKDGF